MNRALRQISVGFVSLAVLSCSSNSPSPDSDYDVTVAQPQLTEERPAVLFDQAHKNHHRLDGSYGPFARLITNDGCTVSGVTTPFDSLLLSAADILITATAMGEKDPGDIPPYTEPEIASVEQWVRNGGALLIITEHYPFGLAMEPLLKRFGVTVHNGYTEDSTQVNASVADALLFERSRGHLSADHPIMAGVNKINTFTGTSVRGDSSWTPLLIFSNSAQNFNVDVKVERDGGDTKVSVMYADHYPAAGYMQGICALYGKGRIVVLAESALLTAQIDRNGNRFGMNVPDCDNKQFALNIIRWLVGEKQGQE